MALINCPECGEKVSSLAEKCVHCGCKLTVCNECGAVWCGDVTICGECGYKLKKVTVDRDNVQTKQSDRVYDRVAATNASTYSANSADTSNENRQTYTSYNGFVTGQRDVFRSLNKKTICKEAYKNNPFGSRFLSNIFFHLFWMLLAFVGLVVVIYPLYCSMSIEAAFRGLSEGDSVITLCRVCILLSFVCYVLSVTYGTISRSALANNYFFDYLKSNNINIKERIHMILDCDWLQINQQEKMIRSTNLNYCLAAYNNLQNSSNFYSGNAGIIFYSKKTAIICGILRALMFFPLFLFLFSYVDNIITVLLFDGLKDLLTVSSQYSYNSALGEWFHGLSPYGRLMVWCLVLYLYCFYMFILKKISDLFSNAEKKEMREIYEEMIDCDMPNQRQNFENFYFCQPTLLSKSKQ